MRVALVGPAYPFRGGISHYTMAFAAQLKQAGHEAFLFNFRSLYPRVLFPGKSQVDEREGAWNEPSERVLHPLLPWTWFAVVRRAVAERADVIVIQWWHVYFAPCLLSIAYMARLRNLPAVVLCHNITDHDKHALLNRLANRLLLLSRATVIVHASEEARRFAATNAPERVRLVQHPIVPLLPAATPTDNHSGWKKQVLFFGLVRTYKGLSDLLRAIALIPEGRRPRLLVVGEFYEPEQPYRSLVNELGLQDYVTLRNEYVETQEIPQLFAQADALVAPYRTASQSGVVRLALSNGLPVIVTRAGGLPDMIEENETGLVAAAADPEGLAATIQKFYDHDNGLRMRRNLQPPDAAVTWRPIFEILQQVSGCASA